MIRPPRSLAFLLAIACALLLVTQPATAAAPSSARLTGTVTRIHDADTLDIAPHGTVRLLGIDAPEKKASSRDEKFLALGIARSQLRPNYDAGIAWGVRHLKGVQVLLSFDRDRRDRYGRLLAYVHLPDGRLLNRVLLEEGLVIVYRRFPFRLKADFLAAETLAREKGAGLWENPPANIEPFRLPTPRN